MWLRSTLALTVLVIVCLSGMEAKKGKKPGKVHAMQSCETNEDCLGPSVCEGRPERAIERAERRAARREGRNRGNHQEDSEDTPDDTKFCKPPSCEPNAESAGTEAICNFVAQFGFNGTCHPKKSRCLYPLNVRKFYSACRVIVSNTSAMERDIDCPADLVCGQTEESVVYNGVSYTISQCAPADAEGGARRGGKGGRRGGRGRGGKGRPGRGGRGHRGHRKGADDSAANALDVDTDEAAPSRRRGGRRKGGRGNQEQ